MPQLPPAVDHTGIFLCIFPQPPRIILFFISSFTISRHNPLYKHCPSSRTPITIATHALRPGSSCCRCSAHHPPSLSKHLLCTPSCLLPPCHTCSNVTLAPYLPLRLPHLRQCRPIPAPAMPLRCPLLLAPATPYLPQCRACPIPAPAPAAHSNRQQNESRPHFSPKCQAGSTPPLAAAPTAAALFFIRLSARQQYLPAKRRRLSAKQRHPSAKRRRRRIRYDTSPVTGSTFSSAASSSPISSNVRCPASALILRSISSANAWLSRNTCLAFSRPCPSFSPL